MFLSLCFCPFPWSINISFDNLFTLQEFGDRINVNYHSWFHPSYLHNRWAPRRIYNPDWCRHRCCTGIPAPSIGDLQHIKIANMNKDLIMSHLFTRMSARLNHMLAHSFMLKLFVHKRPQIDRHALELRNLYIFPPNFLWLVFDMKTYLHGFDGLKGFYNVHKLR